MMKVHLIAAARPNFMKVAPLYHALNASPAFDPVLVHTGQHYDPNMSEAFFGDLKLPAPHHHLEVGSGSHAEQTGKVMIAYERLAAADRPDWIIVVGDVNSTLAAALVGAKLRIPTVHLEAGLRSRDRAMPEEINRVATDAVVDVLWTPSKDADENLLAENVAAERITRIGNIMIDSFEMVRPAIAASNERQALGLERGGYGVVTLHRPSNVDSPESLERIVDMLVEAQRILPLVFPVHPRTATRLSRMALDSRLRGSGVRLVDPLPYIRFMSLVTDCAAAITDSGGIQEETSYFGIPCLTLRENTERPITVLQGTNRLVSPETLVAELQAIIGIEHRPAVIDRWDGRTADRCVADLLRRSGSGG